MKGAPTERAAWSTLQEQLGAAYHVLPIIKTADAGERFPTGKFTVRFRAPVSDEDLASFARELSLKLVNRTRFVDRQAVFSPQRPASTYLPELLEQIASQQGVEDAWMDAESAYRRA